MEIFKLFESTIANVQPTHPSNKDLRRDQLLKHYDEAIDTLRTLIKAKKSEITYRRDLIEMLDKSKAFYDNRLAHARSTLPPGDSQESRSSLDRRLSEFPKNFGGLGGGNY